MRRHFSAGAIIFRENKFAPSETRRQYLLLYYPGRTARHSPKMKPMTGGYWDFTKGTVEEGESLKKTAIRESEEETGLNIKLIDGFQEKIRYFFKEPDPTNAKNQRLVFKQVIFFLAKVKTDKVKISDEHSGYIWLPYEEAIKKLKYKTAKEILKKAERVLNKTIK